MPLSAVVASLRRRRRAARPAAASGGPAPVLVGVDPSGAPVEIDLADRSATLLFLTSTCRECRPIWAEAGRAGPAADPAVVVVTPDPSTESRRGVAALARPGGVTVMSSAGWHDYGVTGAPWQVAVRAGTVVASGPAAAGSVGPRLEGGPVEGGPVEGGPGGRERGREPADGRRGHPAP